MQYYAFVIFFGTGVRFALCFWPPAYKVDLNDRKVFEIGSDEGDLDDDAEDEMIRRSDLAQFESLAEEEERYKPLHSHVERYNKRAARTATEFAEVFPQFEPNLEDIHNLVEEAKPFVSGFKHELDQYDFEDLEERVFESFNRKKRNASDPSAASKTVGRFPPDERKKLVKFEEKRDSEEGEGVMPEASGEGGEDLVVGMQREQKTTTEMNKQSVSVNEPEDWTTEVEEFTTEMTEPTISAEEDYDYEGFKAEYYEQVDSVKMDNKTFNYTEKGEPEESGEDALKKIVDFKVPKNCTKEELTQFGAKAFECLAFDYKNAKSEKNAKRILFRTWMVLRVWIFVYLLIAVPCWCQKGWCCCCFNCAFCSPQERIRISKKYYAENPPGILTEKVEGPRADTTTTEFEPTLFELEAYEKFESAIRNL